MLKVLYKQGDRRYGQGPSVELRRWSTEYEMGDVILESGIKAGRTRIGELGHTAYLIGPNYERLSPAEVDHELIRLAIKTYDGLQEHYGKAVAQGKDKEVLAELEATL